MSGKDEPESIVPKHIRPPEPWGEAPPKKITLEMYEAIRDQRDCYHNNMIVLQEEMAKLKQEIEVLKAFKEGVEAGTRMLPPPPMQPFVPLPPANDPWPLYECPICGKYNCTEIHIIC